MVRKLVPAVAAAALAALPIAGHAAPQRDSADMSGQNEELVGLLWQYIIIPVVLAALLVLLTGDGDDANPESP